MNVDKIIIHGDVFGGDGYSSHIIQLSKALNKHIAIQINCRRPDNWENINDIELKEMIERNFDVEECVNVMIGLPHSWEFLLSMNPKKFAGFFVWECNEIPQSWIEIMNDDRVNQIWVPSNFVKNACIGSGVNGNKIYVVPHGVDLKIFSPWEKINE